MKKGLTTVLCIVIMGAVLTFSGCQVSSVDTPSVSWSVTQNQDGIAFTWDEIQDADGYIVKYNGKADTIETTSYTLTEPAAQVEIVAYAGDEESDPWVGNFAAVETQNLDWYTRADSDPSHPSGLGFNNDGSVVTISFAQGDHNKIDFVADDDNTITAIQELDGSVAKQNAVAYDDAYNYASMNMAPETGYANFQNVVENGTFALLKDPDGQKNNNDIYAKLIVKGIDGTRWTIDITVQPIGGLRWLVK